MKSGLQYQDISCRYGHMRHYQHPAVIGRNRVTTWTEKSVGVSSHILRLFPFINLLWQLFAVFFIIIKYMSIVTIETRFVCSRMLGQFVYDWQENITFGTPIKTCRAFPVIRKCSRIVIAIGSQYST